MKERLTKILLQAALNSCMAIIVLAGIGVVYLGGSEALNENLREDTLKNNIKQ